jgi:hypothetical protein
MLNRVLLATVGLVLLSPFARASAVYTDSTAWNAATPAATDIVFTSVGFGQYFGTYSSGDVTLVGSGGYLFGWGPNGGQDLGIGNYLIGGFSQGSNVSETFSGENQAVGTNVSLYEASGTLDYAFTTNGGDNGSGSVNVVNGQLDFIGIVADSGDWVTSLTVDLPVQLGTGYGNIAVGNVEYGDPSSSTPEPGSLALLGSGMVGLAVCPRRRVQRSVALSGT